MRARSLLTYAAVLVVGAAIGLGMNQSSRGQPSAAAPEPVGRYQITQGIVAGALFVDTKTGRLWELKVEGNRTSWFDFPSPVIRPAEGK